MPAMLAPVKPLLVLLVFLWPALAGAFGAEGHRVVGFVAERHLCAQTRQWLAPLLEGTDLASAGVWADAVRDAPEWAHTKPWHYINVGDRESLAAASRRGGNVLSEVARAEGELADERRPIAQRAAALRFFVHLLADLHQPLHVGRAEDRGGNTLDVRWGEKRMSLHELWDGGALLAGERLGARDLALAVDALSVGQEEDWTRGGLQEWADESRAYRPLIYGYSPPRKGAARLPGAYVAAVRNVVELRLAQAGLRLADRLNRLGCGGAAGAQPGKAQKSPPKR